MKKVFILFFTFTVFSACSDTAEKNGVPVAFAGFDRTETVTLLKTEVELDGTGSYDPDSDLLNYKWKIEHIPERSALADVANQDRPIASFIPDAEGDYVFSLVVDDGVFVSAKDIVVITIIGK
ncbi:MAG: PKD domain-containing protein [Deltaproteobacteria bacterium]|nr:PKD domain-containing protein [Deltaproteobacteria bacterium]